uniref:Uncharacterized protein n=1 Tax=Pristionchus pacificus TaxID=54126 RepID=A0A2A6C580_PRIPA|eukprot:PDM73266.1 hypothetical protein PRIPAC_40622 [Pristionchus pacificus]
MGGRDKKRDKLKQLRKKSYLQCTRMPIRVAQENVQPRWVHGKRPEIAGAAWSHSAAAAAAGVDAADEVAAEEPAAGVALLSSPDFHCSMKPDHSSRAERHHHRHRV